ncbi:thioredoxin domain-containing protein [Paenibacillus pabuli]|uniref:DsbA family protein n=1 Tax=Paenibacillus pabuli TaxID=1472 RepID=UPI0032424D18
MKTSYAKKTKGTSKFTIVMTILVVVALLTTLGFALAKQDVIAEMSYDDIPVIGSGTAPIKIVEVGDFKCPACSYFATTIKPQLTADYIDSGDVDFYFASMPFIGPDSTTAAEAGMAIYNQKPEEFWKFYDFIYSHQPDESEVWATPENLISAANTAELDVDMGQLLKDIKGGTYADSVKAQNAWAKDNGVSSTPTLFINGKKLVDGNNYESVKEAIEEAKADLKAGDAQ